MKIEDELPVPHHSGYVAAPDDGSPCSITRRLRVESRQTIASKKVAKQNSSEEARSGL